MRMIKPKRWTRIGNKTQGRSFTVLMKGRQYNLLVGKFLLGRKRTYGLQEIVPLIGIQTGYKNDPKGMFVGLYFIETHRLWTTMSLEHSCPIHIWRAGMLLVWILEKAKEFDASILQECWWLMNTRMPKYDDDSGIQDIARILDPENSGNVKDEVVRIRNEIFCSLPPIEELEKLIKAISNAGLKIDIEQLQEEINAGKINPSPLIQKALDAEGKMIICESLLNFLSS